MSVSDNTGPGRVRPPSRDDLLLAVIPVALLLGAVGGYATGAPTHAAMGGAALVAALAVLDALFLNPPGRSGGV